MLSTRRSAKLFILLHGQCILLFSRIDPHWRELLGASQGMLAPCGEKQQVLLLLLVQIIVIVLMGALMTYGPDARPDAPRNRSGTSHPPPHVHLHPHHIILARVYTRIVYRCTGHWGVHSWEHRLVAREQRALSSRLSVRGPPSVSLLSDPRDVHMHYGAAIQDIERVRGMWSDEIWGSRAICLIKCRARAAVFSRDVASMFWCFVGAVL